MSMIGKPFQRFLRNPGYDSSVFNRAANRTQTLDATLTVLEDPKNNRKLFLVGTTNSSTFLAKRTKDLILNQRPDSVYVQTNQKWYDVAKNLVVESQEEMNQYNQRLFWDTQEWQQNYGLRDMIFRARFYPWLIAMNLMTLFPAEFHPFIGGLELRNAIDAGKEVGAEVKFGGQFINPESFYALQTEKRLDMVPLLYRLNRATHIKFYKRELSDNTELMWNNGGVAYAEMLDRFRTNWWAKYFQKVAPLQKKILIDDKDEAIFYDLYRNCPGQNIVAVVNQVHTPGIEAHWRHTTGTEVQEEFINPVGDFDINDLQEGGLVQNVLRKYTSKNAKSEPADWDAFITLYHKKNFEPERTRHVYFLGHNDPHMHH